MAKDKKDINLNDIDADFVISSFKNKDRRNNPSSAPKPLLPEKEITSFTNDIEQEVEPSVKQPRDSNRKRKGQVSYKETFIRRNEIKTRECVYISHEIHSKIVKLIRALDDTSITIGGYIDRVLVEHLEQHKDEINEIYRQSRDNLL